MVSPITPQETVKTSKKNVTTEAFTVTDITAKECYIKIKYNDYWGGTQLMVH